MNFSPLYIYQDDVAAFQEYSAHQKTLLISYYQCFQQPQDFNSFIYNLVFLFLILTRVMQVGFSSACAPSSKRRKTAAADIIQGHDGGGRVIRSGGGGRKDRHTKVSTSRGTRDRRVRLSPKTAIQFYDVQDRLGYDRPSKAIDWLMKEAKPAIDALHLHAPPPPLPNIDNFVDTNCFAENHRDGFDCFSSINNGVAAPFSYSSSSSEFQVFPIVDETPEEYSIVDPRYHEPFFTLNYAPREDDNSSSVVRSLPLHFPDREMLSQREPLQSIYPIITANHSPPFPGITFSNDQELLPNFTATNSLLHFQE